jgi:hypothetical protein
MVNYGYGATPVIDYAKQLADQKAAEEKAIADQAAADKAAADAAAAAKSTIPTGPYLGGGQTGRGYGYSDFGNSGVSDGVGSFAGLDNAKALSNFVGNIFGETAGENLGSFLGLQNQSQTLSALNGLNSYSQPADTSSVGYSALGGIDPATAAQARMASIYSNPTYNTNPYTSTQLGPGPETGYGSESAAGGDGGRAADSGGGPGAPGTGGGGGHIGGEGTGGGPGGDAVGGYYANGQFNYHPQYANGGLTALMRNMYG